MADFKYVGKPTFGKTTKDLKIPKADGSFEVHSNVEPNVTVISTTDQGCIDFMNKNPNFEQQ